MRTGMTVSDDDIEQKQLALLWELDGTQPCLEDPDAYIENWTGRAIPNEVAERLCAACKPAIKDKCLDYAVAADEDYIWGGTTYAKRKELRAELGLSDD